MPKTLCIGIGDGIGGSLLTAQCAYFIKQYNEIHKNNREVDILFAARKEIFMPLEYLLWDKFKIHKRIDEEKWGQDNYLFNHQEELDSYKEQGFDEFFVVCPDYLYRNPGAFDWKKYNTHPQIIKSTRVLTHRRVILKDVKYIFCGLTSSTPGYSYHDVPGLLRELANTLNDRIIYFPKVTSWAGINIDYGDLSNLPSNVYIDENPDMIKSIQIAQQAEYGICLDNGFSHILWNLGVPRLLLDARMNSFRNSIPWQARWRETMEDSIPINYSVNVIVNLVKTNLETPQTMLFNRFDVLHAPSDNWKTELIFKF